MSIPVVTLNDFYLEVVRGNVNGFAIREIVGQNIAVGGTEDVWNAATSVTTITQFATAALLYVSSGSASDDDTHTVTITGLDATYDEITETVVMDGETAVA